jgi:hypothetical protein
MNTDMESPLILRQHLQLLTKKHNINRRAYSDTTYKIKRSPILSDSQNSSGTTTPVKSVSPIRESLNHSYANIQMSRLALDV